MNNDKIATLKKRLAELRKMELNENIELAIENTKELIRTIIGVEKTCLSCDGCVLQEDEEIFKTHVWFCKRMSIEMSNEVIEKKINCELYSFIMETN